MATKEAAEKSAPATGEEMKIAAKTTVKFRIAKAVTDAIAPPKA